MELFCKSVIGEAPDLVRQGVQVKIMGERTHFSQRVLDMIERIEAVTGSARRLTLMLAFNYSSRREMVLAAQALAERVARGEMAAEDISEECFSGALMTAGTPDPDLIIRTSGEYRLSNFLLWQASYSEFYFPEVLWPDFDEGEFDKAMAEFARRERRYGLVTEQIEDEE